MDYEKIKVLPEEEFDVYVPELDTTVKATSSDSAYSLDQKAQKQIRQESIGTTKLPEFDDVSKAVADVESRNMRDSFGDYALTFLSGFYKGPAQLGVGAVGTLENIMAGKDVLFSQAAKYIDKWATGEAYLFADAFGLDKSALEQRVKMLEDENFSKELLRVQSERMKQASDWSEEMSNKVGLPSGTVRDIITGSGSVGVSVASSLFSPLLTLAGFGMGAGGENLVKRREAGQSEGQAFASSLMDVPIIGWLNTIGDRAILGGMLQKTLSKVGLAAEGVKVVGKTAKKSLAKKGLSLAKRAADLYKGEFKEEGGEALYTDTMLKLEGVEDRSWGDIAVDAIVQGNIGGLSAILTGGAIDVSVAITQPSVKSLTKDLEGKGLDHNTAETMAKQIVDETTPEKVKQNLLEVLNEDLDPIKYKNGSIQEDVIAATDSLVVGIEDTIKRNELVDMSGALIGDKTEGMPALYQLGEVQVDTTQNPNLGMVLYQAEQEGKPFQTLGQVLEWTKGKLDLEQAQKMSTGIGSVYSKTYEALKNIGLDDVQADANARLRAGMAFSAAHNYGLTVEDADRMLGGIMAQKASEFKGKLTPGIIKKVIEKKLRLKKPTSLLQFLIKNGGIKDEGGELSALDAIKGRPGLVNNKYGLSLDRAREIAEEAGYLGTVAQRNLGTTSVSDLLDKIDAELRGKKVYTDADSNLAKELSDMEEDEDEIMYYMESYLHDKGIPYEDLEKMTFEQKDNMYHEYLIKGIENAEEGSLTDEEIDELTSVFFQSSMAQRINEIDAEEQAKGVPEYTAPTININGVERQTTNSNGDPIAKSEKSLRYFYDWFGDSKVVDEQGRPLVVYHGSIEQNIEEMKQPFIYTVTREDVANTYAGKKGKVYPVYLKAKNVAEYDFEGKSFAGEKPGTRKTDILAYEAQQQGKDGIIFRNVKDFGGRALPKSLDSFTEYVVFKPNQLKAIDNRGTFFDEENRMHYQDEASPRGAYYNNTIYLFENADESTFVHEMSHAYMDVVERLAQGGNAQAQRDLNVIRKWLGKKQGEAFTQADWERFARGFEMYMREGKSPNEYLGGTGGVFDKFKNWLMNIYAGIRNLTVTNEKGQQEPVKINQQIKDFYDEMLGGQDIDKVLDTAEKNQQAMITLQNKLDQLADAQRVLAEERARLVREMAKNVKPDTNWSNVKDWGKNVWESAKELPSNVLQSSYERLAKIDPRLGLLVQRVEQSQGLRLKKWADEIQPFYEAFNNLSAEDKAKVQFYLLNQQWGDVEDIIGKDSTEAVQKMLKEVYEELVASGVEVGYRDNYFPRSVLDYDGLLQEMGLAYPQLRKEMEEAIGKDATPEQQAEWLDKHIMGFKGNVSLNQNRNTKERKLDLITDTMAKYYKPSMETLIDYMNGMAKLLSMREAFGRDIEYKESTAEDSIGKIINNLLTNEKLTKKEIDEVRQVLSALYLPNGMGNKFLQAMRQYGYATKLSYSTTVRQFADIGMMMKVNGVLNTLNALFHPDKRITLETLGIDPLGEEFQTSKKDVGGKIANFATKWKGINWADAIMKNAFMRGNYKALQKLAKTPDKFHQKYDALFGDETDTLIKDLNDNKLSEPVKVLLFHEISKIQPISRSAMPTAYLSNPNGRVFYMFKTFSLHRAEYMVSELAEDFRRGDFKKAGKDIMADVAVIGWEGLVELLIAFLKYGWQAFAAKEVLDTFMGSGLGILGLNKHQALQITRGQIGDFFQQMVGVGTPFDDIGYMIRHYDDDDKLLRAFLPDMIIEPLIAGAKPISNKKKKLK